MFGCKHKALDVYESSPAHSVDEVDCLPILLKHIHHRSFLLHSGAQTVARKALWSGLRSDFHWKENLTLESFKRIFGRIFIEIINSCGPRRVSERQMWPTSQKVWAPLLLHKKQGTKTNQYVYTLLQSHKSLNTLTLKYCTTTSIRWSSNFYHAEKRNTFCYKYNWIMHEENVLILPTLFSESLQVQCRSQSKNLGVQNVWF